MVAGVLFAVAGVLGQAPERKDIDAMSTSEIAVYERAVKRLMKHCVDPMTGETTSRYLYWCQVHENCAPPRHKGADFLPWHRHYLRLFEKDLRDHAPPGAPKEDREVSIPYWDWTRKTSTGCRYPRPFEVMTSPLFWGGRCTACKCGCEPNLPMVESADLADWVETHPAWSVMLGKGGPGILELPHDDVHSKIVRAAMTDFGASSPKDPLFWSVHAFVDMQWDRWNRRHCTKPDDPTHVLGGFDGSTPTVEELLPVEKLGYRYGPWQGGKYDRATPLKPPGPAKNPPPPTRLKFVRGFADRDKDPGANDDIVLALPPPEVEFAVADLCFLDVPMPQGFSYTADIVLHPKDVAVPRDRAGRAPLRIGHFTLWGGGPNHVHADHPAQPMRVIAPVTRRLRQRLAADKQQKDWRITIVFDAVWNDPEPGKPDPRPTPDEARRIVRREARFQSVLLLLDGASVDEESRMRPFK